MKNLHPKKLMLLGSGELGKEVAISAKRLGANIIACDRYDNAPAMQIADISETLDMSNPEALKEIIYKHKPDIVIPEIEALAVNSLIELEQEGMKIIPNANATSITMNRDKIRDLASKELGLKTANYLYAENENELQNAGDKLGYPLVIKPIMSSSGKGQSIIYNDNNLKEVWNKAISSARGKSSRVIVEELLNFDLEITLLTIRQNHGDTLFCPPIGHIQSGGDYQSSWQPASLNNNQLEQAKSMALKVTNHLGGVGLFGVEFFICGNEVIFSELSPRPHDTGLVTLMSQNLSEFDLHIRAILDLPIPEISLKMPSASKVILANENLSDVQYAGITEGLAEQNTQIYIFGKPIATIGRRMGVAIASDKNIENAILKAEKASTCVQIINGAKN